ncbi:hypothetical protein [Caballeronia pedi]|nr:hypothetical protein [Caballeronia pedi]
MAAQTEAMERRILSIATVRLRQVKSKIDEARAQAMTGGEDAQKHYQDLVTERGQLNQVIANARAVLANS